MCYAAYIGTDNKQLVRKFIADQTFLYLEDLTQEKEIIGLRSKFNKIYIYYVGSYQGCSCGFTHDPTQFDEDDDYDKKEKSNAIKSCNSLLSLIDDLTKKETIEFYCCWEGDWEEPIGESIKIDINKIRLGMNYFGLVERRFILFNQQTLS